MNNYTQAQFVQIQDLIDQNRHEEALNELRDLIAVFPEEASLYVLKGNALQLAGRLEEAIQAYKTGIEMDPMNVEARSNLSAVLYKTGYYVDALNAADAAILTDKNFAPAYVNAANALITLGHMDHGAYALKKAFELDPSEPLLGVKIAELYFANDDYERARDVYFEIARMKDIDPQIHELIADLFKRAKEKGITRLSLIHDIDAWRAEFASNPTVFELAKELTV